MIGKYHAPLALLAHDLSTFEAPVVKLYTDTSISTSSYLPIEQEICSFVIDIDTFGIQLISCPSDARIYDDCVKVTDTVIKRVLDHSIHCPALLYNNGNKEICNSIVLKGSFALRKEGLSFLSMREKDDEIAADLAKIKLRNMVCFQITR